MNHFNLTATGSTTTLYFAQGCTGTGYPTQSTTCSLASVASNKLYTTYSCPATLSSSSCFAGSESVTIESGEQKTISEVEVGDRILSADSDGKTAFATILSVPHGKNPFYWTCSFLTTRLKSAHFPPTQIIYLIKFKQR